MERSKQVVLLSLLMGPGGIAAAEEGVEADGLKLVASGDPASSCGRGAICFRAGADYVRIAPSPPVAVKVGRRSVGAAPTLFERIPRLTVRSSNDIPWALRIEASFARPALAGNALFVLYDLADANALLNHEVTALHQHSIPAGPSLTARLQLSSNDGFRSGHTYRLQVVQLIGGREVILAQGDFSLR